MQKLGAVFSLKRRWSTDDKAVKLQFGSAVKSHDMGFRSVLNRQPPMQVLIDLRNELQSILTKHKDRHMLQRAYTLIHKVMS